MGNLPTARTITLANGDPIPSNLLNEIQDQFVGDKRALFRPARFVSGWTSTGGAPTLILNPQAGGLPVPVWNLPTTATFRTLLGFDAGDVFSDIQFDIFGDGVADWNLNLVYATDLTAAPAASATIASGGVNNSPASWTRYTMSVLGAVSVTTIPMGYLQLEISIVNGAQIRLGDVFLALSR